MAREEWEKAVSVKEYLSSTCRRAYWRAQTGMIKVYRTKEVGGMAAHQEHVTEDPQILQNEIHWFHMITSLLVII